MIVQHTGDDKKGSFFLEEGGQCIAEMVYVYAGTVKFIIEHTEVDPAYEGKGLGKLLVAAAVEFARENNMKIIPLCPYAHAVFKKTPEYIGVWLGK